ncbi:hypothetical protein [Paenibacillus thermotolerans]|uniref:hypothetical protein n=1 Tax=Paenibacillus thermotolerans TaxID=3027807 RepID=UPI002368EEEA|nr:MULTISPECIES: hypothetical protein [unclassified Paenibacillus]
MMHIEPFSPTDIKIPKNSRVKYFTVTGPKGSLKIGITFTKSSLRGMQYQLARMRIGDTWIRENFGSPIHEILKEHVGATFQGTRETWFEEVYNRNYSV